MDRLLYIAMTGASGTMNQQASIAQNLANISTPGYRAEEHRLRAVQVQTHNTPAALPTRAFTVDANTYTDFSAGPMQMTDRPLDVAIKGQGWLAVTAPDGTEAYTRYGNLQIDANGTLMTMGGQPVVGDTGPINVPPDQRVVIGDDGTISIVPKTGLQTSSPIGRLKLVNPDTNAMQRRGDGLFAMKTGLPADQDDSIRLATGYIEGSNVNPAEQLVSMISLQRQFEMQIQMITNAEANDKSATAILTVS